MKSALQFESLQLLPLRLRPQQLRWTLLRLLSSKKVTHQATKHGKAVMLLLASQVVWQWEKATPR